MLFLVLRTAPDLVTVEFGHKFETGKAPLCWRRCEMLLTFCHFPLFTSQVVSWRHGFGFDLPQPSNDLLVLDCRMSFEDSEETCVVKNWIGFLLSYGSALFLVFCVSCIKGEWEKWGNWHWQVINYVCIWVYISFILNLFNERRIYSFCQSFQTPQLKVFRLSMDWHCWNKVVRDLTPTIWCQILAKFLHNKNPFCNNLLWQQFQCFQLMFLIKLKYNYEIYIIHRQNFVDYYWTRWLWTSPPYFQICLCTCTLPSSSSSICAWRALGLMEKEVNVKQQGIVMFQRKNVWKMIENIVWLQNYDISAIYFYQNRNICTIANENVCFKLMQ